MTKLASKPKLREMLVLTQIQSLDHPAFKISMCFHRSVDRGRLGFTSHGKGT